jgi:DNA-directed RNA polymerase specialized sigma24 family protein
MENDIDKKAKHWKIDGFDFEDIKQELYLFLWEKLDKYDKKRGGIRTFCVHIMDNFLKNLYRNNKKKPLNRAIFWGVDFDERKKIDKKW